MHLQHIPVALHCFVVTRIAYLEQWEDRPTVRWDVDRPMAETILVPTNAVNTAPNF